jgi:hypothetical protein
MGVSMVRQGLESKNWPIAEGRVVVSRITKWKNPEGDYFSPDILYEYKVDGILYSSSKLALLDSIDTTTEQISLKKTMDVVSRYPIGQTVQVYYKPENPNFAVLEPGPRTGHWVMLGVGAFLFIMTLIATRFV